MMSAKAAVIALAAAIASIASLSSMAGRGIKEGYPDNWQALDPREVALLPEYCKYTQTYRSVVQPPHLGAEIQKWTRIMGPTFNAIHHYCNALLQTNRATLLAQTEQFRMYYLDASIGEIDYVLHRAPPDFILLPEILTKKGDNQLRLGRPVAGQETLQKAMAIKPDYWPAYAVLADYYKEHGHPEVARQVLEKALEHSPDAEAIKRRLADLSKVRASK